MRILPVICYFFFSLVCTTAAPVPYAGKIALNGANFNGTAQFIFELRDSEGTVHWRNGAEANASISVPVDRGHYVVLLGGQGMNPLSAKLFLEQPELYLQVRFYSAETQEWLHMLPDHGITSVPHALSADMANLANLAKAVEPGAITRSMLAAEILADLNASVAIPQQNAAIQTGSITRDMLSTALRSDLNRTVEITRGMLSADVLNDLNRSIVITRSMLPAEVLADLNATITRSRLAADVLSDLDAGIAADSVTFSMLAPQVRSDINSTISRSRLAADILSDLNATITRSRLAADVLSDLDAGIAPDSVTLSMLAPQVRSDINSTISRSRLAAEVLADLNATITRSRLAADVLSDLDAGIAPDSVTLSMLAAEVRSDINSTISRSRLAADILSDLNATITRSRLAADVLSDLDAGIAPDSVTLSMLAPQVRSDINSTISRSRLAADVLVDLNRTIPPATVTKTMLAADVLADLGSTIAPGSITSSLLAPGLLAELNSTTPEASVTASKMHPDLIKYFLPEISSHPVGVSVLPGTGATLSSEATGKFLTYQWQRNGVDLSGETNATLVFTSANAAHDANYTVVVSNDWGSVTSNASSFTVATNAPVITLIGAPTLTHEVATSYTDAGATALDALDGNLTASIVVAGHDFNNSTTGDHNVTYNVSDAGGNAATEKVRTVTVVDSIAPVITLVGDANVSHGLNTVWNDPGVTAIDTRDGNLSAQVAVSGTVDVNSTGANILTYHVSDAFGNVATTVTRTVNVVQPPSGPWSFTNAGVTGRLGPTQAQVDANYSGTTLAGDVVITTQGIQEWTVPATGIYAIEAWGAQGGSTIGFTGGKGARMKGNVILSMGDVLQVLIGQQGVDSVTSPSYGSAGGGGGSFVAKGSQLSSSVPLVVAGGGGGSKTKSSSSGHGGDGLTGNEGGNSAYNGGASGNGGARNPSNYGGFAGGGFFTGGLQGANSGKSGFAFVNGGQGGIRQDNGADACADGGFGGGGGGMHNQNQGGGGGGGYSGGSAGHDDSGQKGWGGGGGSYNSGTNHDNTVGANQGQGKVTITWVGN